MTLEETIQDMFDEFPILFQTREEALNQLFCVIGNGFDWYNGQMIESKYKKIDPNGDWDDEDNIRLVVEEFNGILGDDGKAVQRQILDRPDFSAILKQPRPKSKFYPLCEYSKLCNYPPDIQPDWELGRQEAIVLVKAEGVQKIPDINHYKVVS